MCLVDTVGFLCEEFQRGQDGKEGLFRGFLGKEDSKGTFLLCAKDLCCTVKGAVKLGPPDGSLDINIDINIAHP